MCRRGWTRIEALVVMLVVVVLFGVLGVGVDPKADWIAISTANLGRLGAASTMYRNDMKGYLPEVLSYRRGSVQSAYSGGLEGWCTWSAWGKNCNGWWGNKNFDVEAADRPANSYIMPWRTFSAPPMPARLAATAPERQDQAFPLRDPGDVVTFQRAWPNKTPGVTGYDDVGSSYMWSIAWWDQIYPKIGDFENSFKEGTRRLAAGEGVSPSRFVWAFDQYGDLLATHSSRSFKVTNAYGDVNFAASLFYDGHSDYINIMPRVKSTPKYSLWFE